MHALRFDRPEAVEILIRLGRNWQRVKDSLDRQLCPRKREQDETKWDALEAEEVSLRDALYDHPLDVVIEWLVNQTGKSKEYLRQAAFKGVGGEEELVAKLKELDRDGSTDRLFQDLDREHPELCQRLFPSIRTTTSAEAASTLKTIPKSLESKPTTRARAGRPKADYKTIEQEAQLAARWNRARDSGVYKPVFAKGEGLKLDELKRLLGRVGKRNARSGKKD